MLETLELGLFWGATATYGLAWAWHLAGWQRASEAHTGVAVRILWAGWLLNVAMVGLRWYRAEHVPMLSAFEFVTFFVRDLLRDAGRWRLPAVRVQRAQSRARRIPRARWHPADDLRGVHAERHRARAVDLQGDVIAGAHPDDFDQMAYRAAFFAFAFLTLGIITGALWGDRVFGQLWFWDPKETWSFITWLIFMAYLHARYTLEWRGRRAAILAIVGFAALVFTYVGVDFLLPQIHGT
jgi:ABC-type transport system involved in cytochrome c biogenesis permease subunit